MYKKWIQVTFVLNYENLKRCGKAGKSGKIGTIQVVKNGGR